MTQTPMTRAEVEKHLPPRPWSLQWSETFTANGLGHVYLVDATGKKIAALWGQEKVKEALGEWLLETANLPRATAETKGEGK